MATVRAIESALYELAPRELAMEGDNVGLLVGRPDREVREVLVALDITAEVVLEAVLRGAELIVAHHPVIFRPVGRVTDQEPTGRVLFELIQEEVSAICMHTNLDRARGGVNDVLAARLGLEHVQEAPGGEGILRWGELPGETALPDFLAQVREALRPNGMRYTDGERPIRRVAVGGGSCGDFLHAAAAGCDAFVTADLKYHQFLEAKALGLTVVDAGHFPTENVVCPVLADCLRRRFPELSVDLSASHQEAIQYYV